MKKAHVLAKMNRRSSGFVLSSLALLCTWTLTSSCGTETGNPVIKRPTTPRNIAQDVTESDLLELSESLTDHDSSTANLALYGEEALHLASDERIECSGDAYKATTIFEKSKEVNRDFPRKGRSVAISFERKLTTEWISPSGGLTCVGNSLKKSLLKLKGLTSTRVGSVKRSIRKTNLSTESGKADYRSASFASSGSWKQGIDNIDVQTDVVIISRTNQWELNRSSFLSTDEGENSTTSSSATLQKAPLKVKIVRRRDTGAITSRTIESGTTKTTLTDGSIVEISYDSVVYSEGESCYPSKGIMRGKITSAVSDSAQAETFEVDFSTNTGEIPEILFEDGEKVTLAGACSE